MGFSEVLEKPLLPETDRTQVRQHPKEEENAITTDRHDLAYDILLAISFIFLTYNSVTAAYRSRNNILQLSLIVATYIDFVLLFLVVRELENTPFENVGKRERLKVATWVVVSTLNVLVSYQVAVVLPFPFQVVVYVMAATFFFASFLLCFVFPGDASPATTAAEDEVLEKDEGVQSMV